MFAMKWMRLARFSTLLRMVAIAGLFVAARLPAAEPGAAGEPRRIVFLAGGRSHGPGEHEFHAGCRLLATALNEQSGLRVKAEVIQGWPADPSVLDGANALVFYSDGTSVVGKGWEKTDALVRAGTGVMFMHYAVHPSQAEGERYFRPWMGGAFEDGWSVNPHWVADLEALAGHPVSRGITGPVVSFDEFYYNMRFRPERREVLDLVTAVPSRDRIVRYINLWNEHGVAGLGKRQTLMWGVERPDGGRGVGFTGGHYHRNWAIDGFRTLVLNAVAWTAGLDVPAGGVRSQPVTEEQLNANLDDKGANKPRLTVPTLAEIKALKPAEIQADREAKFPRASATQAAPAPQAAAAGELWRSKPVLRDTPGRAVEFDVPLGGTRKVWLVVSGRGDIVCDWADWVQPRFVGPAGEKPLAALGWKQASAGWGGVQVDRNAEGGPLKIDGKSLPGGIGTHAPSVIEFDVPEGMTRLVGRAGLDDGGANQGRGDGVEFSIHSQPPRGVAKADGGSGDRVASADPAEAVQTLLLPADLEATLFAAEPLLSSPSDIDVDSKGRVWACEVMNYRHKKNTRPDGDRILVLEDTDGDGKADKQTVFHQGRDIDSALGICVIGEGPGRKVIVSCAPDVFIFHDDDGDLKADRKESLFTKTGQPQHDHSVHAFSVGPDGRWYFNFGNTGHAVHDKDGNPVADRFGNVVNDSGKPYRQGMVFRCKPDGTDFEVLGHNFRNNYEVAVDSFGSLWQSDNDDDGNRGVRINYVMEYGNFGFTDEQTGAGWQAPRTNLEAEVPLRHWHQNDPGVVPNLLLTGGGSPCGICVYEGSLLPKRFHGSLLHSDAGPNVVRAYHVEPSGAGFKAESEAIVDGAADTWFRPSDVCVAPDGSVIVADWHDPGVGGHGMGDIAKGRIFRIAPKGSKWSVPPVDLGSVGGAVAALSSPNLCTRATALARLAKDPEAAATALEKQLANPNDERHAARLAWAVGMLPGRSAGTVKTLLASNDPGSRIVGLRICRLTKGDVIGCVDKLVADQSAAVRREAAIALKGRSGERADRAWAELAARHTAGDRWELEALGIGADGLWDGRLNAWLVKTSGRKDPAGREIVWRSRGARSAAMQSLLIADADTQAAESLALIRALDFQSKAAVTEAVKEILTGPMPSATEEKLRVILPELVTRLEAGDAVDPAIARRISEAAGYLAGTPQFVQLVQRFAIKDRYDDLIKLAAAENTAEPLAAAAAGVAVETVGPERVQASLAGDAAAASRLLTALGVCGSNRSISLLTEILTAADGRPELKAAAVRGLARSQQGGKELITLAKAGSLSGVLPQVAAVAIAAGPWGDLRAAAADVLPMPKGKGGDKLPPIAELSQRRGNPDRGKALFAEQGTCAKCHVVAGAGKSVGPDLSGVGAKLSRDALYESVLAPSAAISHSYETYTAIIDDGRSMTGLLVSQSPREVVIRPADGIDVTIPAASLEQLVKQPVSLMPADLATLLSADDLVDVVTWLETLRTAR